MNVLLETSKLCFWAGKPCDSRGGCLLKFLNMNNEYSERLKNLISEDEYMKNFYNVQTANI